MHSKFKKMITKKYLKSKPVCKVIFRVNPNEHSNASSIFLAGDFNDWDEKSLPLKKTKSGVFSTTIDLETEKSYEFRYLVDGKKWENDWNADQYVPSKVSFEENSVVSL